MLPIQLTEHYSLIDSSDLGRPAPPGYRPITFPTIEDSRRFLHHRLGDAYQYDLLRRFLLQKKPGLELRRLTPSVVVDYVAELLAFGQIILVRRSGPLGGAAGGTSTAAPGAQTGGETAVLEESTVEEEIVTVQIRAENGIDPPPGTMGIKTTKRLKAVPSRGSGTYQWSTTSTKVTLSNTAGQTVTVRAGDQISSSGSEVIKLLFTPSGKPALPPLNHSMLVGTVVFSREPSHPWGYDAFENVPGRDKDNLNRTESPAPDKDFISIKKGQIGKIKVDLKCLVPSDVYFKSADASVCEPKLVQPTANSLILEIEAKNKNNAETDMEAHVESDSGPVVAKIGVVVLKEADYKAKLFRVKDSDSPGTALSVAITVAGTQTYLNDIYNSGVAAWRLNGSDGEKDLAYDKNGNGFLDMEPGTTTDEQKAIAAACWSLGTRVIQVHDLRWAYYLAADAKATDGEITLKAYGGYLDYIGLDVYPLADDKGASASVSVSGVDTATGKVTLAAPIGQEFKVADKAALIWPLGGLSGNPIWVKDPSSAIILMNVIGHELGHQVADLSDLCEIANLMHGISGDHRRLRRRGIKQFYYPTTLEEQWPQMKR
jgi:hypothetical protein